MSNEYDERVILLIKNVSSIKEGMLKFEEKLQKTHQRLESLMGTITMLQMQVTQMNTDVAILKALSKGRGSTGGI